MGTVEVGGGRRWNWRRRSWTEKKRSVATACEVAEIEIEIEGGG